ncbi:CRE-SPR-1 protein [Aphelenchoides avenae]|nr:CRE-SPR-1 protein [Aphelenchus avenae]
MTNNKKKPTRVGPAYQADPPLLKKTKQATENDREKCVWRMRNRIDKDELKRFYNAFTSKRQATRRIVVDHALYILMNNNYDFERAMQEAKTRRPPAKPWTVEDEEALFSAFKMVEKNFAAIARMFPEKSTNDLVEHYYNTKKRVNYRSHRNAELRNEKYKVRPPSPDLASIPPKDSYLHSAELDNYTCQNCGRANVPVYDVNGMLQCLPCKNFFQVTEQQRPCRTKDFKRLYAPYPRGMEEVVKDFVEMAEMVGEEPESDEDDVQVLTQHHRSHVLLRKKAEAAKITAQLTENKLKKESQTLKARSDLVHRAKTMLADINELARTSLITDSWSNNEETVVFHCLTSSGYSPRDVAAIALCAQNETGVTFDKDADAAAESELVNMAKNAPIEIIELE